MLNEHAVPEPAQEKTQGDKLENAVGGASDKGSGLTRGTSSQGAEPTPQDEPLK